MNLSRVHLTLDNVQYGDVAMVDLLVSGGRHHHVLGLQQASHHVEDRRLANGRVFGLRRQWSVPVKIRFEDYSGDITRQSLYLTKTQQG